MLSEAKKPQYTIDGLWLRYFRQLPPGIDGGKLNDMQKEFVICLLASAHPIEAFGAWMQYELEKRELDEKDFTKNIKFDEEVMQAMASARDIPFEEYREREIKKRAEKAKETAIKKLHEKYGISSDDEEEDDEITSREQVMQRYSEIAKELEKGKEFAKSSVEAEQAEIRSTLNLLSKPEGVK